MNKIIKYVLLPAIALLFASFFGLYLAFPNTSILVLSLLTHQLPDTRHIDRIRNDLLVQESFINMLVAHEKESLNRFEQDGQRSYLKRYIHKTPTAMFDLHSFHDYWQVWVRTDIVNGRPLTSFLVRLGLIKDTNAETFFSNQCRSEVAASAMRAGLSLYNNMFDWGVFKPIRLNITESDQSSSVSRVRIKQHEWSEEVRKQHQQGVGVGFVNLIRSF
ncbi:MAG: hypothetical protein GY705_21865 [Bacteroidetes bacterium]|nr:hypothetical protein [Bacteroidota bacterium]